MAGGSSQKSFNYHKTGWRMYKYDLFQVKIGKSKNRPIKKKKNKL